MERMAFEFMVVALAGVVITTAFLFILGLMYSHKVKKLKDRIMKEHDLNAEEFEHLLEEINREQTKGRIINEHY